MITINILTDQTLQIDLAGKATAGYTWSYICRNPDMLRISRKYIIPDTLIAGGAGIERFSITGLKPGICHVDFKLSRSWEQEQIPLDSKSYLFHILPAPSLKVA
ncbi:MAG: protease inhibitor I42 family protein [Bacteroidia bacterium]